MILLYNLLMGLLMAVCLPLAWPLMFLSAKRRKTILKRLGMMPIPDVGGCPRIWVHALSVGEVISARPLIPALRERFPHGAILFSASTYTGFQTARETLGGQVDGLVYFPYDLWVSVSRAFRRMTPDAVVIVETDIWPNFLTRARMDGIPVFLVNGRLSDRSFAAYRRFGKLIRPLFAGFEAIGAQSEPDARRFVKLGAAASRTFVAGNFKFDQPDPTTDTDALDQLRQRLSVAENSAVWVAGSTHDGEESILFQVYSELPAEFRPGLIVAPRDPGRAGKIRREASSMGLNALTLTEVDAGTAKNSPDIVIIDRIGLLKTLYGLANFTFVGGSLVPEGGHNPLEPAAWGVPVIFGPDMSDFRETARLLTDAGGAVEVPDAASLQDACRRFLESPASAREAGRCARACFEANKGAVALTADRIAKALGE